MARRKRNLEAVYISDILAEKLEYMAEYPVVLVEAGAGFGKTTAVNYYFKGQLEAGTVFQWLTCTDEPAEETWSHLCDMLRTVDAKTAVKLHKYKVPERKYMGNIAYCMSKLSCTGKAVLVIDNYQLTGFEDKVQLIHAFSSHLCSDVHIVFITQDIGWQMNETVYNPDVYHITTDSFFFSKSDIAAYFTLIGKPLSEKQLDIVCRTTEGWAAAIRLQAEYYMRTGKVEDMGGISSLMKVAFWNHITARERRLFCALSAMETFTANQAAVIVEHSSDD